MKTCTKCSQHRTLSEFNSDNSRVDGLRPICKPCRKAYLEVNKDRVRISKKSWYEINKDYIGSRSKTYYLAHKEERIDSTKIYQKSYKEANKDKKKIREKAYYLTHKERIMASVKAYGKANPDKIAANNRKRQTAKLKRTPLWLTKEHFEQIRRYYTVAKWVESILYEPIEVDHIVPLQGGNVSGLHVPWNLQLLTEKDNCSKGNRVKAVILDKK